MSAVNQTIGLMFLFWRCSDCLLSSFRSDPAACTGGPSSSRTRRRPCSWQCSPTWATASSPSSATCVTSSATGRSSGATLPERGRSKRWGVRPGVRHRSWAHINQEFKNFFLSLQDDLSVLGFIDTSDICFRATGPSYLHVIPICDICDQ